MSENDQDIFNQIKAGKLNPAELEQKFSAAAASSLVTVSNWEIVYASATGQLSAYANVTSNDSGNPITGVGLLAYSGDGTTLYCLQYDGGFSSSAIDVSIGTSLYNPQTYGDQALCVVYGWTQNGSYYLSNRMTIGSD